MFKKRAKLNQEDLIVLRKLTEMIDNYRIIMESLEIRKQLFFSQRASAYNLDPQKNYKINFNNGVVEEEKEPHKGQNK